MTPMIIALLLVVAATASVLTTLLSISVTLATPSTVDINSGTRISISKDAKIIQSKFGTDGGDDLTNSSTRHHDAQLNFIVGGFPKCGTTSLLYAFRRHNETVIPDKEVCGFNGGTPRGMAKMQMAVEKASTSAVGDDSSLVKSTISPKHGIKCPLSVWNSHGMHQLSHYAPGIKLILGVRHPILFFQSYFNYRVTSMHDKGQITKVPPAETLMGVQNHWKEVSTDIARFELGLMQLGKVALSKDQLHDMKTCGRSLTPVPWKIFLYSMEQLADKDDGRSEMFRGDMRSFLDLSEPITISQENKNHFVGSQRHPETIDICEARFKNLRALLVKQGSTTSKWILEEFVASDDVSVGGSMEHFAQLLSKWSVDPCV